jgi:hypothetical protein
VRNIPEAKKPRHIAINTVAGPKALAAEAAPAEPAKAA